MSSKIYASHLSWWDLGPYKVREKLNQRILSIKAPLNPVKSIQNITIKNEKRSTPIRIYFPYKEKDIPIILLIHGGAWVAGNLETHDNLARYLCAETDALVLSVGYLNAPEGKFPFALEQCYDALNWIIENAQTYSADSSKIAVVGDSAGGI
ncbi:MAG: alpha/beta hydrolase fold domain-containing protein [Parachlamydiaceae bacterium]|nr:MAG: alpha/beta hydrolase fold domain-containing protein [Parachlamydiaceae bacterium]